ncbi:alpha,alpha-phosphotrehalase [Fusobacteria bacterium ZRK30]|nr:alpha,alpha-phosphotrehalase [Fusobacteria bacterium ZRK30]
MKDINKNLKDKVVYQIYPMSFMDTTGNGIGDIRGIISKLDYLENLGVDLLWLTPIYSSPKNDNGYDIADYYQIDPDFGTMEDFDLLLSEAEKRGMGILMDIVANHTSTEHIWFKKALAGEKKYQDYYVFREKEFVEDHPITSIFGGDAWKYIENLDLYYLHNFDKTQADLDWDNEEVRKETYKMMNFWLEKGVKGFRFDVIDMISKIWERCEMSNGPKLHEYIEEMADATYRNYDDTFTVGETWSADLEHAKKYSNLENTEFSTIFTFEHTMFGPDKWSTTIDLLKLKEIFEKWQKGMHNEGWNSLFYNNHDLPRAISRYGDDREEFRELSGKGLAILLHLMEGTPYIYQGEEIGMINRPWTREEMQDVEAINYFDMAVKKEEEKEVLKKIENISRDNARTPVQWEDSKNAGFTDGTPWIEVNESYKTINVKGALEDKNSIFYTYKELIKIRKKMDLIKNGTFDLIDRKSKEHFSYMREHQGKKLYVFANMTDKDIIISEMKDLEDGEVIISNYNETYKDGNLRPYEAFAIKVKSN